ncbi:hypothetical protein EGW08_022585, partial [Elysia chlorotica]
MPPSLKPVTYKTFGLLTLVSLFSYSTQANCKYGYFGDTCGFKCHCDGGDSHCTEGNCTKGCDHKYIGPLCQYRAFPPIEEPSTRWMMDGNPNTCNNGNRHLVAVPTFVTRVTYMRVTFRKPDRINKTEISMYHVANGTDIVMTCSRRFTRQVDEAGKVYDVPCYTARPTHSITFDGEGALHLCEILISPGRNIAPFQTVFKFVGDKSQRLNAALDGLIYQDRLSLQDCAYTTQRKYQLTYPAKNEVNMILVFNSPETDSPLIKFRVELESRRNNEFYIFNKVDNSYSAFFIIIPDLNPGDIKKLDIRKPIGGSSFFLCEVETLGEQYCCTQNFLLGSCIENTTDNLPACHKRENTPCKAGFIGDFCEDPCPRGYHGHLCKSKCDDHCHEHKCDPVTGDCIECNPGYHGSKCLKRCPSGFYGSGCSKECSIHCKTNKHFTRECDYVTGHCLNGCLNGRIGENCQYDKCSDHCKGGNKQCDGRFGTCLSGCEPGYIGLECYSECPKGTYGDECLQECRQTCDNGECDNINGNCTKGCIAGFQGAGLCDTACEQGTYGKGCKEECSPNCIGGKCDIVTGKCFQCDIVTGKCFRECSVGYKPPLCNEECDRPYFGTNCAQRCSSSCQGGLCHPFTGVCNLCKPGAYGSRCHKECPQGKYGVGCLMNCADNCQGQTSCEADTGTCTKCPPGRRGPSCNDECNFGKYGPGCNHFCSEYCHKGVCNKVDGSCTEGCVGNYKPPACLSK